METLTFDRDALTEPETLSPETLLVCPLSLVQTTVTVARVSHLVTLINGETRIDTPKTIGHDRHLRLSMVRTRFPTWLLGAFRHHRLWS